MDMALFNWLFANPAGYAIAGGLGGFLMDSLHKGFIEFPQRIQNGGKSGWTLGFTAAVIAGLFAGILADNNMLFSFLAGAGLGGVVAAAPTVLGKRRQYRYDRDKEKINEQKETTKKN